MIVRILIHEIRNVILYCGSVRLNLKFIRIQNCIQFTKKSNVFVPYEVMRNKLYFVIFLFVLFNVDFLNNIINNYY